MSNSIVALVIHCGDHGVAGHCGSSTETNWSNFALLTSYNTDRFGSKMDPFCLFACVEMIKQVKLAAAAVQILFRFLSRFGVGVNFDQIGKSVYRFVYFAELKVGATKQK